MDATVEKNRSEDRIDQAADFTARIYSGAITAADEQALKVWLDQSVENREAYQAMLDTWSIAGAAADRLDELDDGNDDAGHRSFGWAMAASVVIAGLVLFFTWPNKETAISPATLATYTTTTGEQEKIPLNDGSVITLNTNTRVLIDYSESRRRVILERGEAFFDVESDPLRPFIVNTGARTVTVLGTRFDIRKAGFQLQVAVVDGVVAVHGSEESVTAAMHMTPLGKGTVDSPSTDLKPSGRYRLEAGVLAIFPGKLDATAAEIAVQTIANLAKYPDWRFGAVRFNDQPLREVVKELNRYTHKKILIEDSRILDMKISGVFQIDTIDTALLKLEQVRPVRITQYPDRVVIVGD